jgi:hypothetical protein
MEPTPIECAAFDNIDKIVVWAGLGAKAGETEDLETTRGSLLALLDVTGDDFPRVLGSIPADIYNEQLALWKVNGGHNPSMSERSKGVLLGKAARILCGLDERVEVLRQRAHEIELAKAAASSSVSSAAPGAPATKKVKLSTVADQANDLEVPEITREAVQVAYANYHKLTSGPPARDVELTAEQLTSMHALLQGEGTPYVDFAVWGPYGHRIARKVKMSGYTTGPQGELRHVECYGPPSFHDWEQSFKVWKTGLLMFNAVSLSAIDGYRDLIYSYWVRYGVTVWLILYQADVRARLEHLERMRREGASLVAAGAPTGKHTFNPEQPWDWCLRQVTADTDFWRHEMEEPAIIVLAKAGSLSTMIGGDAPVSSIASSSSGPAPQQQGAAARYDKKAPSKRPRGGNGHYTDGAGQYSANRRGTKLCNDFQAGTCQPEVKGRCPRDGSCTHQCAKCLSPSHGAKACQAGASADGRRDRKGNGKGKSKYGGRPQY